MAAKKRKDDKPTPEEIRDVLADPGYSADQRKGKLKEALTELERDSSSSGRRRRLAKQVKQALADSEDAEPMADDTL